MASGTGGAVLSDATPRVIRIVLAGGECTGKTTLASEIAGRHETVWVPEAARTIAEMKEGPLDASDVERIARAHVAAADVALLRARRLLVLDQDLFSTVVYAHHYYGTCPPWIEEAALQRRADLYLLCHPDVPWVADPARDRPDRREDIHSLFAGSLASAGANVADIYGVGEKRLARALTAVGALLK